MRRYETVWVVNGDLPDEEVKSTIDKFTGIIANQGGTLINLEEWGRKKLAYKIAGTMRGFYLIADFAGQADTVRELERNYRIDDRIIRYLTFKKADHIDLEAVQAEIARLKEAREAQAPEAPVVEEPQPEAAAEIPPAAPAPETPPVAATATESDTAAEGKEE
jgi:small subunit ribosomal protein S6